MEEKINVLIVEDEWITSEEIKEVLESNGVNVVGQEDNGERAIAVAENKAVDVAILDINIKGGIDGIEVAKRINQIKDTAIIFLTAYDDKKYIERAKQVVPAAYMVKPFQSKNLVLAIELAFSNLEKAAESEGPQEDHYFINDRIFIKEQHMLIKVLVDQISYVEAVGSYCDIHTIDKKHTLAINLKTFEERLSHPDFMRVHRSFLVNMTKINAINGNTIYLDDAKVPMGSNKRNLVLERFKLI